MGDGGDGKPAGTLDRNILPHPASRTRLHSLSGIGPVLLALHFSAPISVIASSARKASSLGTLGIRLGLP